MSTITRFGAQLRATITKNKLSGHAAVFGQVADVGPHYEELTRTAFDAVLENPDTDVRALRDHDASLLLGRQSAGTLRLGTDSEGLEFEVDLPNTSYANDLRELVERGDLDGASFGFIPRLDEWDVAPDRRRLRRHTSLAELIDVSAVTFPAYTGATVALRSKTFDVAPASRRSQLIQVRHRARYERKTT